MGTTPQEKPFEIARTRPDASWPQNGEITFKNVWMKYRAELDYVLKGLTFDIRGGEKIGVIGRTGAGKSSLFVTLLRLVEIEAIHEYEACQVEIDGVNVAELGLFDLRPKLSVIPQDPVLFTGTIRFNLDPFEERSDADLIEALRLSHCLDAMKRMAVELQIKKERDEEQKKEKEEKEAAKKQKKKWFGKKEKNSKENGSEGDDKNTSLLSAQNGSINGF